MQSNDFSILMAVYHKDDPLLFDRALLSIFLNTVLPAKIVLVVDGPIENSLQRVIDNYEKFPELKVLYLKENLGLALALNEGLRFIDTEWIVRFDSDDYNEPNRFEMLCQNFHENIDIVGSWITEVDKNGDVLAKRVTPLAHEEIIRFMKKRNPFNHVSVAYRASLINKCGGYPNLHLREDYGLWAVMFAHGARMKNIPESLVRVTTGFDMYARRGGWIYAIGEFHLQKMLVNNGLKSFFQALVDGFSRSFVFLLPGYIRKIIYEKILR